MPDTPPTLTHDVAPEAPPRRPLGELVAINTTLLFVGRLVLAGAGVVGVAMSTRYLGRDAFGELTVALGFVAVAQLVPDLGIWTVTAREVAKRPEEEQRLLSNAFALGLVLSVVTILLALGAMQLMYPGDGDTLVRRGIVIVGAQLLFSAVSGTASAFMTARQRAAPVALGGAAASVVFLAILIVAVEADLGFTAIASAYAVTSIVAALVTWLAMRRSLRVRPAADLATWRQLARWAAPQGGVLIIAILYFRIDTILLSLLASDGEVALYGVGYRVVEVLTFFPMSFMVTLFPEVARMGAGSERLRPLMSAALSALAIAALAELVLVGGFSEEIVAIVGGGGFAGAASVLRLLSLAVALVFLNTAFFHALLALNRQTALLLLSAAVFGLNVLLNFLLIPGSGAQGAGIALVASEALMLVLVVRYYSTVDTLPRVGRPLRILAAAALMAAAVVGARALGQDAPQWLVLALGAPFATAVLVWALHVLRAMPPELEAALAPWRTRLRGLLPGGGS